MRRLRSCALVLVLAATVHVDWHLARPAHHRLSLAWSQHWVFAVMMFAVVGWLIARWWPATAPRVAASIVVQALILGQIIEPILEVGFYERRFGYPDDPERWAAFATCIATGLPALIIALALCRRRSPVPAT